ncbi:DUF7662 domain-containing protein [Polymorphum gilvum]|nr:hypothetical protein [Polymorphum gilvum]
MAKYDPLRAHLARLDEVLWAARLEDVEQILGSDLPKSAREHRTWWANSGGSLVHQNAWLDAGWRVERTDLKRSLVVFRRLRIGGTAVAERGQRESAVLLQVDADKASGSLQRLRKAMQALRDPVTVTVRAEWTPVGDLAASPCRSDIIPDGPGICRLATLAGEGLRTTVVDARDLAGFHRALRRVAAGDGSDDLFGKLGLDPADPVELDIVRAGNAWILSDGRGRGADLAKPGERELVARLLSLQERQAGRAGRLVRC